MEQAQAWSGTMTRGNSLANLLRKKSLEHHIVQYSGGRVWRSSTSTLILVALLLLCSLYTSSVDALIVQKSFTTTSYITVFQKFAFDVNGTLHFEKTTFHPPSDSARAFFYLCDSSQWPSFVSVATDAPEKLCQYTTTNTTVRVLPPPPLFNSKHGLYNITTKLLLS